MQEIGAFEAKNQLSALLARVEQGEEIMITRRGKPVAKLTSPVSEFNVKLAMEAADRIRKRSENHTLNGMSIKDLINEDRK